MARPKILDLCCGAGGAGLGYYGSGFDVVGVDIVPQPRYPFEFVEADVMDEDIWELAEEFDAIHTSPPCQSYSKNVKHLSKPKPKLIARLRHILVDLGKPYVIENVPGAPLQCPVELCGHHFGLRVKRHRLFECNFPVMQPRCDCDRITEERINPRGTNGILRIREEFPYTGPDRVFAEAMGVPWMHRGESREAIPPVYTRYIGQYLRRELRKS